MSLDIAALWKSMMSGYTQFGIDTPCESLTTLLNHLYGWLFKEGVSPLSGSIMRNIANFCAINLNEILSNPYVFTQVDWITPGHNNN